MRNFSSLVGCLGMFLGVGEGEFVAQVVHALYRARRVRQREPRTPAEVWTRAMVLAVDLEGERVVPGFPVVRRVDEIAEAVRREVEARAARAIGVEAEVGPVERQLVHASHTGVCPRDEDVAEQVADSEVPLARLRHFGLAVDEPCFRRARGVHQGVQRCLVCRQIRVVPRDLAWLRRRIRISELDGVGRVGELERLID